MLITKKGTEIKKLDLTKKPSVKMFFVLFEAIYFEKKEILQTYFSMQKKGNIMHFQGSKSEGLLYNVLKFRVATFHHNLN